MRAARGQSQCRTLLVARLAANGDADVGGRAPLVVAERGGSGRVGAQVVGGASPTDGHLPANAAPCDAAALCCLCLMHSGGLGDRPLIER